MKNNKKTTVRRIGLIVLLAILAIFLFKPQWIPFISDQTTQAISDSLRNTFNSKTAGNNDLFSLPTLFSMLAVIVCVLLACSLLRFIFTHLKLTNKRSLTVLGLLLSVINYAGALVIIIWCLSIAGVNLSAIFASLGILSLIVGFGAQSLIEDVITGIFIIFEGQYNVGDIIILDDFRGTVQRIGVRTTCITDAGGNIKIVNNSDIRNLQNRSDNPSVALCDVGISYSVKVQDVEKVLENNLHLVRDTYPELYLEDAKYLGVQELGASAVILRVMAKTKEQDVFKAQRCLNRMVKIIFDDNGIEVPFTQIVIHEALEAKKKAK